MKKDKEENIYFNQARMKVRSLKMMMKTALDWHEKGQKVVFTNGCFDILHRGHIEYLSQAASLGDRLIIGLNSDESVKRLKGNSRPIMDEESRAYILASLYWVDGVVIFEEDTPIKLIEALLPDILVKGGDYEIEDIVGAESVLERGGKVKSLDFVEGYSTSTYINKIKESDDDN